MIRCALRRGEHGSDNLSLWSFALDHVMWLYTKIPQRLSGVTPLEMATNCKADHTDLACTHVWGCPCYVLDPVLQNNNKIPNWNRRARMGHFVGFSRLHSSAVALVCNFHTGHISPQYHVALDNKAETVFSNGWSSEEIDTICNSRCASNHEFMLRGSTPTMVCLCVNRLHWMRSGYLNQRSVVAWILSRDNAASPRGDIS